MRLHREGLKKYYVQDDIDNSYFISIEYEMIHQNMLEIFVPMQIREKDGVKILLYDVTEGEALDDALKHKGADFEESKTLLESIKQMFEVIAEYMLQIEHVSFSKKDIYLMKDGRICWMYRPDYSYEVKKDAEEFFAWMLSKIDYSDQLCIRFIYHAYDEVRNKGISKKVIEDCLQYGEDLREKYLKARLKKDNEKRKEAERKKEAAVIKQAETVGEVSPVISAEKREDMNHMNRPKKKKKNSSYEKSGKIQLLRILCVLGMLCSVTVIFCTAGAAIRYGFQINFLKYLAGGMCLGCVFISLYRMFLAQKEQDMPAAGHKKRRYAR